MIVGRVRVGHQQGRTTGDRQFGDGRGAGAADHQMGAGEPVRHIGEKAFDLGGDAAVPQLRGDPREILGPRLLTEPQRASDGSG